MSDPFWDDLDQSLPRHKRGEAGWSHQRAKILSTVRGEAAPARRLTAGLAAGLAVAALTFAVVRRDLPEPPPAAHAPADELELMEHAHMLDHLEILLEAEELDPA